MTLVKHAVCVACDVVDDNLRWRQCQCGSAAYSEESFEIGSGPATGPVPAVVMTAEDLEDELEKAKSKLFMERMDERYEPGSWRLKPEFRDPPKPREIEPQVIQEPEPSPRRKAARWRGKSRKRMSEWISDHVDDLVGHDLDEPLDPLPSPRSEDFAVCDGSAPMTPRQRMGGGRVERAPRLDEMDSGKRWTIRPWRIMEDEWYSTHWTLGY